MLSLILLLVLVGVALYFIGLIPMDPVILQVIRAVVIVVAIFMVLHALGLLAHLPALR